MQRANLLLALAAASIAIATAAGLPPNFHHDESPAWTSFCVGNGGLHAESGVIAGCHSYGFFTDKIETTGWSYLHVESDHSLSDHDQAYAAGFAEGFLSSKRIQQSIANTFSSVFPRTNGSCPQEVYTWLTQQQQWIATQVAANPRDTFWTQVAFTYQQITGMSDGATAAGYKVSPLDLLVMNAAAEVGDIQLAINATLREELDVLNMHDFAKVQLTMARNSHCSALIRLAPDGSDLFSAHTTWTSYQQMLRTYKHYSVAPFGTRSKGVQFSSYPGAVSSIDDYYQTSSGLIVIETTNNVANMSLYDLVNYTSVLTFARAAVANRLAADGETWTQIFARENSGTYNNQWMVVDNKMFTPHQPPRANTLWILSQFPGGTRMLDATPVLTRIGFWPSYNIPYFPEVWTLLGYGELVKQYGANGAYLWNYSGSFRNLLFTRDAPHVSDLAGMQAIIQSNKWQTDPLSHGSAELAIAARMDLSSGPLGPGAQADGAIDAKLSSASFMRDAEFGTTGSMSVLAKSGPTVESQPPFTWSSSDFHAMLHEGQPDTFNFEWQKFAVVQRPNPTQRKDKAADKAPRAPVRIALE